MSIFLLNPPTPAEPASLRQSFAKAMQAGFNPIHMISVKQLIEKCTINELTIEAEIRSTLS